MTREEMLKELHSLNCRIFWPGAWDDIGFTEHQMWVNSKGYGYFYCDEPNTIYKARCIPAEKWKAIRSAISNDMLTSEDIAGTSLADMCFFEDEESFSNEWVKQLLSLPEKLGAFYYCAATVDGPCYFSTEKELLNFLKRDWCDTYWEDLDDETLALWITRLHKGALEWNIYTVV